MKIAVMGGSGFLGTHIVERLAVDVDNEVIAVSRGARGRHGHRHRHIACDLYATQDLRPLLEGVEACIHLVSDLVPASAERSGIEGLNRNLDLADRLASACLDTGVGTLVFSSSGGTVYGRDVIGARETLPCHPIGFYGVQKVAVEALLRARLGSSACRATILRIGNPYGAGQESQPAHGAIGRILGCLHHQQPFTVWGDGTQVRDYIHVGDVADAVAAALAYDGSVDLFNIGSGAGVSMSELIAECERVTGRRLQRSHLPHPHYDVDRISLDIALARSELGWNPGTSLVDGLHNYYSLIQETP